MTPSLPSGGAAIGPPRGKEWRRRIAVLLGLVFVTQAAAAFLLPELLGLDPNRQSLLDRLQPPSAAHWLGTDEFGRDQFARLLRGTQISVFVGIASVLGAALVGGVLGAVVGWSGGLLDLLVMRTMDLVMSFPTLVLALGLVAALADTLGGVMTVILAIGMTLVPDFARIVRSQTLSVRESPYLEAAKALGATAPARLAVHVVPNVAAPLVVMVALRLGSAMLTESSLSFLGVSVQPPTPTLGGMVAAGLRTMDQAPWLLLAPAIVIVTTVTVLNLLGDSLRDALDPHGRIQQGRRASRTVVREMRGGGP